MCVDNEFWLDYNELILISSLIRSTYSNFGTFSPSLSLSTPFFVLPNLINSINSGVKDANF